MQNMEEACPQLLDLIPNEREWLANKNESHGCSEDKKLELRLGPPGQDWSNLRDNNNNTSRGHKERDESLLSLGYFHHFASSERKTVLPSPWSSSPCPHNQTKGPYFLQFSPSSQSLPVTQKASQPCCTKAVDLQQSAEKKKASASPAVTSNNNTSQKRTAPAPVVGWPPIRSFRKNLASTSSSKPAAESQTVASKAPNVKPVETNRKGMFVKINMDGVPIGRKVDLSAYASYEKLSSAVDELFRGFLAAQRDSCAGAIKNKIEEGKEITGLLDGSGEYTLIYEDNEGDRMLVGDVPWHMFVSTVKRLRVLKSSELSALSIRSSGKELKI